MSLESTLRTFFRGKQIKKGSLPQPLLSEKINGSFDTCDESGRITGWAFNSASADDRLHIEILADGIPVANTIADLFRADLQQAGIGDGRHGFEIMLPDSLFDGQIHAIEVREAATGTVLPGSPNSARTFQGVLAEQRVASKNRYMSTALAPGSTSGYFGFIDAITKEGIRGWVLDTENCNEPLTVSIFLSGERIGEVTSGEPRADIASILGLPANPGLFFNWLNANLPAPAKDRDQECAQLTFILEPHGLQMRVKTQPKVAEVYFWVATAQKIALMEQHLGAKDEEMHRMHLEKQELEKRLMQQEVVAAEYFSELNRYRATVKEHELLLERNKALEALLAERDLVIENLRKQGEEKDESLANWKAELQKDMQRFEQIINSAQEQKQPRDFS